MDKSSLICPQCLHKNSDSAEQCSLCDCSLQSAKSSDDINLSNEKSFDEDLTDADLTQAPDFSNHETQEAFDADSTVAPDTLSQHQQSIGEQHTFHLAGDLSHFEVLEILGQGGMGAVYHAKDRTLHRDVALKMLRPISGTNRLSTEALLDEARMASKLNHPNIVTIYDVARSQDSNYIVMEWVDGEPLDELIPEEGLPLVTAIDYARQIAHGLSSAHQKYIIHRDIKPQNIMLSEQSTLKILDFGIAGLVEHMVEQDEAVTKEVNLTTPTAGTPSYMSPEQARGLNLDPRSDIYSLGIVLYQMLTGQRPFTGKNSTEVKQAICAGRFTPIEKIKPELPAVVVDTVNKMLATAKDQRWQSSGELATALDDIYNELTYSKNWWQKRHWLTQAAMLLPFIVALGWTTKDILFPASTQQLIEQQLAEATKVAILPFNNISGDPTLQLFGEGLGVNLSTDLATVASEIGDTWIVPATEISRIKEVTPKAVADKYGVELILTGSMQHMGSTRLVVLNLLDAQSGQQLKTTELNIDANDLFAGHVSIRAKTMELLDWPMSESLTALFNAERPELDGAYKHYVEGRGYLYRIDQPNALMKAEKSFIKAIDISPGYTNAYIGLAETQLMNFRSSRNTKWLNDMDKTIFELEKFNNESCEVIYLKAELLTKKGDYQTAIKLFSDCIKINPRQISMYLGIANAYSQNGDIQAAENFYLKALEISPNNVKSIIDLAIFYYRNSQYGKTIEYATTLSQLAPNNHHAYIYLGASYYSLNMLDEAIHNNLIALELKPTHSGFNNLGSMYFLKKNFEKSIDSYLKAIELMPTKYKYWGNLGEAYKITKNSESLISYSKAAELAKEAVQLNPNDSSAIASLSLYLANLGHKNEATKYANKIGVENNGWENYLVAQAYDVIGEVDAAIEHLKHAIEKNYSLDEILNNPFMDKSLNNEKFISFVKKIKK